MQARGANYVAGGGGGSNYAWMLSSGCWLYGVKLAV